jgi:hypothetical protein
VKDRHPHHIGAKVRIGNLVENIFFNFGGPPKTNPSSGIKEKEQADVSGIVVELRAQRLKVSRKPGERNVRSMG